MPSLEQTFTAILFAALAAVVLVLAVGIVSMFRGGEFNARWSNRLMRARVGFQLLAVLLLLAFAFLLQDSG